MNTWPIIAIAGTAAFVMMVLLAIYVVNVVEEGTNVMKGSLVILVFSVLIIGFPLLLTAPPIVACGIFFGIPVVYAIWILRNKP